MVSRAHMTSMSSNIILKKNLINNYDVNIVPSCHWPKLCRSIIFASFSDLRQEAAAGL